MPPTLTVAATSGGPLDAWHTTALDDVHAVVPQLLVSTRALGVLSLVPKPRPLALTVPTLVRCMLSTPR
jgi:hypothetical protein